MPSDGELGRDDLVFYGATIFERSLDDKLLAAESGGFAGVGLWASDLLTARASGLTDGDVRQRIADRNLRVAGIDCLFNWAGYENPPADPAFNLRLEDMIEAAVLFGAPSINLAHAFGTSIEAVAPERLAAICGAADAVGLLVTIEPIPWGGIPTLEAGHVLIIASGAANARLAIDAWHFFRSGGRPDDIANLSPQLVGAVQLCDAAALPGPDPWADTSDRRPPTEGELPVAKLVEALRGIGFAGPLGIECPSAEWHGLDAATIGRRCGDAMRRLRDGIADG